MRKWTISNLAHVPYYADTVADRGWTAWWRDDGISLANYRAGLEPMLSGKGIPCGYVAHRAELYLGSVLLIENDLESRPKLKPWVAALWVDVPERGQGIASDLMIHARSEAAKFEIANLYLCAVPQISSYYQTRGWRIVETGVDGLDVFEMATV